MMRTRVGQQILLAVLPCAYMTAAIWLRASAGQSWLWFNTDPTYFYIFDAIHVLSLQATENFYHPGGPVQLLGAFILKLTMLTSSSSEIVDRVLANPEAAMRSISLGFVLMNATAIYIAGHVAASALKNNLSAIVMQAAPFFSMLIMKNSVLVKPEALLVLATVVLGSLAVISVSPGKRVLAGSRFAIACGIVAGFGVATKLTAGPLFLLPLFLLRGRREVLVFFGVSGISFLLFVAHLLPNSGVILEWFADALWSTGAYGSGGSGFADWSIYPQNVLKLLTRPLFIGSILLGLMTVARGIALSRSGVRVPAPVLRLIVGIVVCQLIQVLFVAKQPSAHYLIPSYLLSGVTLAILIAIAPQIWFRSEGADRWFRRVCLVLVMALGVSQFNAVSKTAREFANGRDDALAFDDRAFSKCARIYFAMASSKAYGLLNGDFITGQRFSDRLAKLYGDGDYWLEHSWHDSPLTLRDWKGVSDPAAIKDYPCVLLRGSRWSEIEGDAKRLLPALEIDNDCSTRHEAIYVSGSTCDGD